jgi:hypothetical protein
MKLLLSLFKGASMKASSGLRRAQTHTPSKRRNGTTPPIHQRRRVSAAAASSLVEELLRDIADQLMLLNLTSFALRSSDRDGSSDENQANTIRAISAGVQTATDLFDTLTETLKKDDPNRPEPWIAETCVRRAGNNFRSHST